MSLPELSVIDASRFPLLSIDGARMAPGDGARIIDDLESLIQNASAFVLVIHGSGDAQDHDHGDDKERMLWLKENKVRLATVCKGIISVAPDKERFALVEKQTAGLRAALGIHFAAADSLESAEALAHNLLELGA
jgi:hypothetical protein